MVAALNIARPSLTLLRGIVPTDQNSASWQGMPISVHCPAVHRKCTRGGNIGQANPQVVPTPNCRLVVG